MFVMSWRSACTVGNCVSAQPSGRQAVHSSECLLAWTRKAAGATIMLGCKKIRWPCVHGPHQGAERPCRLPTLTSPGPSRMLLLVARASLTSGMPFSSSS